MDLNVRSPLLYKMTHPGDPQPELGESSADPAWGRQDCMGEVRDRSYDAVIGVGGVGREASSHDMKGKIQWIGIGPRRWPGGANRRGVVVTFDRYLWFGAKGPSFWDIAPTLAQRMLGKNARVVKTLSQEEQREVTAIIRLAADAPPCHPTSGEPPAMPSLDAREEPCGCSVAGVCALDRTTD